MRVFAAIVACCVFGGGLWAEARDRPAMGDVVAWKAREAKIQKIAKAALPAVVSVEGVSKPAMGSGIVIDSEGHVLTAAHVVLSAGERIRIRFPDGTAASARALGANLSSDTGLVKIEEDGPWPFVRMGKGEVLVDGDWVVAMGHPGGYDIDRTPPLRLGRVWNRSKGILATDCALASGDSGGPLFNLDGEVVGIHSSIGENLAENRHIATEVFRRQWKRLKAGERWGSLALLTSAIDQPDRPMLGVILKLKRGREEKPGAVVETIVENSPADRAGLLEGDRVLAIGKKTIAGNRDLIQHVSGLKAGETVPVRFMRGGREKTLKVKLTSVIDLSFPGKGGEAAP